MLEPSQKILRDFPMTSCETMVAWPRGSCILLVGQLAVSVSHRGTQIWRHTCRPGAPSPLCPPQVPAPSCRGSSASRNCPDMCIEAVKGSTRSRVVLFHPIVSSLDCPQTITALAATWVSGSRLHGIHQRPRVWHMLLQPRGTAQDLRCPRRMQAVCGCSVQRAPISNCGRI